MRKRTGNLLCNTSYALFLAAGGARPFVCEPEDCGKSLARTAATLLLSTAVVQVIKQLVPERRPDTGQKGSFPSGHSANTIALAAVCSAQNPDQSLGWILPAVGITVSRVALRRHHIRDIIAGSLIGLVCAGVVVRGIK